MNKLHKYWIDRELCGENGYSIYVRGTSRSKFLYRLIEGLKLPKSSKILELGCNVGRNLNYLQLRGYTNLTGVEINRDAINYSPIAFPNLKASLICSSAEDFFKAPRQFDVIFTIAVLEHLPKESDYIFSKIASSCKHLIVVEFEGESKVSRIISRNYLNIFSKHMTQINEIFIRDKIKSLENYTARVFKA